ncbi:MAG: YXWGXW repeat-containing protein [Myxococcales bacterium]|nr:YXWGXW repeat-containing protein [Myxococcales bacterium]
MTLKRVLSAFVLATAVAAVAPACIVTGTAGMRGTVAYSQPPPPQEEVVEVRTGQVWIRGRWDYQGGQWVWINGRWEQDRSGYRYNDGQWVQRGSSWHWVEGQWVAVGSTGDGSVVVSDGRNNVIVGDASEAPGGVVVHTRPTVTAPPPANNGMYPTAPPPTPRAETYQARPGFLWINGRWDWVGGRWEWIDGHWERERANQQWSAGRWELRGNYYVWIEGSWR